MLLHRDEIVVNGPYQLCASIFVKLELLRSSSEPGSLLGVVTLCDAMGKSQSVIHTQPFGCADFCLVVTQFLPFNLEIPPREMRVAREDRVLSWEERDMKDRSLIYLHSVYDRMRTSGYRIPFFNFLLRILEHTSNLRLTFVMEDDVLSGVEVAFGVSREPTLVVRGRLLPDVDALKGSFIPLSEGRVKT